MELGNFKINCIFDFVDVLFQFVDYLWVEEYTHICDVFVVVYGGYYTTFVETYYSGAKVGVNDYDGGTSLTVFGWYFVQYLWFLFVYVDDLVLFCQATQGGTFELSISAFFINFRVGKPIYWEPAIFGDKVLILVDLYYIIN